MRIAVFASGSGSNFAAIVQAIKERKLLDVEVAQLVSDRPEALAIGRAQQEGIPVFSFHPKQYESKADYERGVVQELEKKNVDLIVLAGYMRLIGPTLLKAYDGRMINLHPSLLPSFQGKDAIGQALEFGVKVTGVTVHFVDEGMDTGPIIAQRIVEVATGETRESLTKKIQEQEHQLLPEVIGWFAKGLISKKDRKVEVYEQSIN